MEIKRIELTKRVFRQGEIIPLKIHHLYDELPLISATVILIGTEKTEFTLQSIFGKKGFHPTLSMILPSKHFNETYNFLESTFEINPTGTDQDIVDIEIPMNAIPSFYGDNSKVSYNLHLELQTASGVWIREKEEILVDSEYKISSITKEIEIGDGFLTLALSNPLLINSQNSLTISSKNIKMEAPIRFFLSGEIVVTASGVTVRDDVKDLPLGQIYSKEDIMDFKLKFQIPPEYQHSYEGLQSRLEYYIELFYVSSQKRLGLSREKLKKIYRTQVQVEEL